jgi:hypothetical protein
MSNPGRPEDQSDIERLGGRAAARRESKVGHDDEFLFDVDSVL